MSDASSIMIRCSCGGEPQFDSWREIGVQVSAYACAAAPQGCGRSGPEIRQRMVSRLEARAAWNAMREKELGR